MKITRIKLWRFPLTSHTPYYMSDGKSCKTVDSMVLSIETDSGLEGWGEVCPIPHYLPAYANGVRPVLSELAPVLIGVDPIGPEAVMAKLEACLQGHVYAKSAIDIALWDLTAKYAKVPLCRLLGGRRIKDLPLYHSISCLEPEEMARIATVAKAEGVEQFQVKLGADKDWQADVARLRLVREAVGPGSLVYGDWNCGVSKLYASRVGRALGRGDFMLEQPCKTLSDCAAVRRATGLPMKIDENAHDTATLLEANRMDCMDAVAIKLSKFGGISASRRARDLCLHLGAQMCIEDTWGSDICTSAALHLAQATDPSAVLNVCDLSAYVGPRLDNRGPVRRNGRIEPSQGTGLGIRPDTGLLGAPVAVLE